MNETQLQRLCANLNCSFLFADCLIKFVLAGNQLPQRQQHLNKLPTTLEDAFADMIKKSSSGAANGPRGKQILSLVAFAERPLGEKEIKEYRGVKTPSGDKPGDLPTWTFALQL